MNTNRTINTSRMTARNTKVDTFKADVKRQRRMLTTLGERNVGVYFTLSFTRNHHHLHLYLLRYSQLYCNVCVSKRQWLHKVSQRSVSIASFVDSKLSLSLLHVFQRVFHLYNRSPFRNHMHQHDHQPAHLHVETKRYSSCVSSTNHLWYLQKDQRMDVNLTSDDWQILYLNGMFNICDTPNAFKIVIYFCNLHGACVYLCITVRKLNVHSIGVLPKRRVVC